MSMYDQLQQKAFAGMKGDSRYDLVESFAAENEIPFGAVVTQGTTTNQVKLGGTSPLGIALHSHAVIGGYVQFDAVSVLRKGVAWCVVKDGEAVTAGGAVNFDPVSGKVANTGTALPNATFKSDAVDCGKYGKFALVELA
ncbi:structural cement protein Gp24 [Rodentibacter caecimuris]|uniref:structural cement protein Gp24 n=1 Tax=Rodentibacter caecimuris TaxID=1796644 RepID=UPI00211A0E10|nr:hypothetical protein [Rodentibacter heylii]MCQ9124353.1 hypothetical protein [Rodentibacter heylii]